MRSVNLTPIKCAVQGLFPAEWATNTRAHTEMDYELNAMRVRLERYVMSERLADEAVCWPTTWWDAFKERWFPVWALLRWPAHHSHAEFTVYRGYPDLVMPERGHTLFIQRNWPDKS